MNTTAPTSTANTDTTNTTSTVPTPEKSPVTHDRMVIGIVGFVHGVSHFFHLLIPPLYPWLMPQFHLSYTEIGLAMTAFFIISGFGQAAAGLLVDRLGSWLMLVVGMSCFIAATILLGVAQGLAGIIAAAVLAGLGNSIFHPADYSLLNHRVGAAHLPQAFAMHGFGGNLGWAAAPVFLTTIAAYSSWRTAAFAAGGVAVLALVLLVAFRRLLRVEPTHNAHHDKPRVSTQAIFRVPAVWLCFLFFFLVTMAFGVIQNYLPAILQGMYGLTTNKAAGILSAYLVGGGLGVLLGGYIARHAAQEMIIAGALLLGATFILLLAAEFWPTFSLLPILTLVGLSVGVAGPARDMLVRRAAMQRLGPSVYGRVYGFVYSGLDLGLALSPLLFGKLMNHKLFAAVLIGAAISQILAILTAFGAGRSK